MKFFRDRKRVQRAALRLIARTEEEYGFDSRIKRVIVMPRKNNAYYYSPDIPIMNNTISLPLCSPRSLKMKTLCLHELAHAVHFHYRIKTRLKCFQSPRYIFLGPRPEGFVGCYAQYGRYEDFADTFACYLTNRKTWHCRCRFEGETFDPRHEPRLYRKLETVHQLLKDIRHMKPKKLK